MRYLGSPWRMRVSLRMIISAMRISSSSLAPFCCVLAACFTQARGLCAEDASEPHAIVEAFTQTWDEAAWGPTQNPGRPGYMRPLDDAGWKARMKAFQALVKAGPESAGELRRVLQEGSPPERILAAQVLGFLRSKESGADLARAAEHDADPAVRLYAVDSLAMLGGRAHEELFRRLEQNEKNRDVKRHLAYARERDGAALDDTVIASLKQWDAQTIDSARLGQSAPDFELASLSGEKVRLSDFRGKKPVVLVFIYGDT